MSRVRALAPTEHQVQVTLINFLRIALPRRVWHHSPNEVAIRGKGGMIVAGKQTAAGTVTGWPDIEGIGEREEPILFFETKRLKGGRLSEDQARVGTQLEALGHRWAVARSIGEIEAALARWGIAHRAAGNARFSQG